MTDITLGRMEFPDNIDLYPAGPELDALLAEIVLGAEIDRYRDWAGYVNLVATGPDGAKLYIEVSPHYAPVPLWNPSTNPSDAQVLIQYLYTHSDYRSMSVEGTDEAGYSITLWARRPLDTALTGAAPGDGPQRAETYSVTRFGPTLALAVCRAVYKVALDMRPRQVDNS
jgi:hypothetical protein